MLRRGFLKALFSVPAVVAPGLILSVGPDLRGAGYWGIQLTLTTSAQSILTLLRAVDASIPQRPSRIDVQFDTSQFNTAAPYSKVISVGDANVTVTRKAYGLLPGGTSSYLAPTDLGNLFALGNITGLLLNVQVQA